MRVEIELKRHLGCGLASLGESLISGELRPEQYSGDGLNNIHSHVEYIFFTLFFLPIYPAGCKRTAKITYDLRTGAPSQYITKKKFLKNEKMKFSEILKIYLHYWLIIPIGLVAAYSAYLLY